MKLADLKEIAPLDQEELDQLDADAEFDRLIQKEKAIQAQHIAKLKQAGIHFSKVRVDISNLDGEVEIVIVLDDFEATIGELAKIRETGLIRLDTVVGRQGDYLTLTTRMMQAKTTPARPPTRQLV